MRIGIFGGSFNPIHTGHTRLGRDLCRRGLVDEIWFLVSPLNPFKQGDKSLLPDIDRLRLVQLATQNVPGLQASDFEMRLPRPSYMIHTLTQLRKTYLQHTFVLIIGADNWLRFSQWKDSEEILRLHDIIIYPRPGYDIDESTLPSRVHLFPTPMYDISSTQIRQAIAKGNYHGRGLTHAVWHEICLNNYYRL